MSPVTARRHWVFDMDGTLTRAVHDFDAIRRELELPAGAPILEALAVLPAAVAAAKHERLAAIEWDLAAEAEAQPGAAELLEHLHGRGARLGILTRNDRAIAYRTLDACGLRRWFDDDAVLGRDEAPPKPDPAGVVAHLTRWGAAPTDAVMVGDFLFDLQAGRAAGTATVSFDPDGAHPHAAHADLLVDSLQALVTR